MDNKSFTFTAFGLGASAGISIAGLYNGIVWGNQLNIHSITFCIIIIISLSWLVYSLVKKT